jgi:hypothetical protein
MRKSLLLAAALALTLPSVALAGSAEPSSIEIVDVSMNSDGAYVISGSVHSSKKCEKGRKVKLLYINEKGTKVIDKGTTSDRGAFAVEYRESDGVGTIGVRVAKSEADKKTCGSSVVPVIA